MKRTETRTTALVIGALFAGWLMGASGIASSQAEEVTPAPVVQGEIIKVCINLKTGAIRAASKCDSKTERKTVLGGAGAQGPIGAQGIQGVAGPQGPVGPKGEVGGQGIQGVQGDKGPQGDRGFTGLTGATGSVSGLRTKSITVWEQSYGSFCSSYSGFSVLNGNTSLSQSSFSNSISLNKSCSTLSPSTITVYAP
jgi:hypothetical protein